MEQKEILKLALSAANSIHNETLKVYTTEFEKILHSADQLSHSMIEQQKSNDSFMVFDILSKYQADYRQWLETKIEQISNTEEHTGYWTESLHAFEKSIAQITDLVNEPFDDSIFEKTAEDSFIKFLKKKSAKHYHIDMSLVQRVLRKNQLYLSEGRKFSVHGLLHFFFLAPVSKILLEYQLKANVIHYNNLETLRILNEQFKDDILKTKKLEQENYWEEIETESFPVSCNTYIDQLKDHFGNVQAELNKILKDTQNSIELNYAEYQNSYKIAGSRLLPKYKFSAGKYIRLLANLEKQSKIDLQKWDSYGLLLCDEWIKDLELSTFQFKITRYYFETLHILKNNLDSKIKPIIAEIKEQVTSVQKKVESLKDIPQSELKSYLKKENHLLTKELHTKYLPNLIDVLTQANLEKVINILSNKVSGHLDELSDIHTIITDYSQKRYTPVFKSDKIKFKELIQFEIMNGSSGITGTYANELNTELESLKRKISNIDQVVEYNLEAAIDMLDSELNDKTSEAHEIAVSGLQRAIKNLDDIDEDLNTFLNNATIKIANIASDLQQDIQKLGDNEGILQLKIRIARAQTKEKIIRLRSIIWLYIKTVIPKIWRITLKSVKKIRTSYRQVKRLSGLAVIADQNEYAIFDFISEYKNKFAKLPFIYQRLFSLEPLDDQRFFTGRDVQFNKIKSAFERFLTGQPASLAVIGEKGNGKTSLIYFAIQNVFVGHKIHVIDFHRSVYNEEELKCYFTESFNLTNDISIEALIEELLKTEDKCIVILENLHNLFLRCIDGFNAIETLLLIMSRLGHNYFWLITSGLYGWEYLNQVINISSHFHHTIELNRLNDENIEQLIERRHKASGYGLNFMTSAKFDRNRSYRKLKSDDDRQVFLRNYFFKNLAEDSNGNIKVAMQLWLSAINKVEDEDIYINTELNSDYRILQNLTNDENFTLAAFVQHEYLTVKEHAKIFHQSEEISELMINRLYKKGILDLIKNNYVINTFIYRPIIKNLTLKNILN